MNFYSYFDCCAMRPTFHIRDASFVGTGKALVFLADVNKIPFVRVPGSCDMWIVKNTWHGLHAILRSQSPSLLLLQPKIIIIIIYLSWCWATC